MPAEVFRPAMPSGIKQAGESLCLGVDAGEVWPLVEVTTETGIGQIAECVATSMLFRHDVLDLKRREDVRFGEMAVFALTARAFADLLLSRLVHP